MRQEDLGTLVHQLTRNLPFVEPSARAQSKLGIAMANNRQSAVTIKGVAPKVVLLDTAAQPVIISEQFSRTIGLAIRPTEWSIRTAGGEIELVVGEIVEPDSNLV